MTTASPVPARRPRERTLPDLAIVRTQTQRHYAEPSYVLNAAALWEQVQDARKRAGNLLGAIERSGIPVPATFASVFDHFEQAEHECVLALAREWRKHPLAPWQKTVRGLGEHHAAVLVAMLGGSIIYATPMWWEPGAEGEPDRVLKRGDTYQRTIGQLWSYCGIGDPERRRHKDMSQDDLLALGKPRLKARCRLIAESFIKANNPRYRVIYDDAKTRYATRVHDRACPQCHAKEGDPWKPGHAHAAALRLVAKRFLQDAYDAELAVQSDYATHSASDG